MTQKKSSINIVDTENQTNSIKTGQMKWLVSFSESGKQSTYTNISLKKNVELNGVQDKTSEQNDVGTNLAPFLWNVIWWFLPILSTVLLCLN